MESLADLLADTSGPKRRFYREIVILCTLGTSPEWEERAGVDGRTRTSAWLLMTLGQVYATKGNFIYNVEEEEAKLDQILWTGYAVNLDSKGRSNKQTNFCRCHRKRPRERGWEPSFPFPVMAAYLLRAQSPREMEGRN